MYAVPASWKSCRVRRLVLFRETGAGVQPGPGGPESVGCGEHPRNTLRRPGRKDPPNRAFPVAGTGGRGGRGAADTTRPVKKTNSTRRLFSGISSRSVHKVHATSCITALILLTTCGTRASGCSRPGARCRRGGRPPAVTPSKPVPTQNRRPPPRRLTETRTQPGTSLILGVFRGFVSTVDSGHEFGGDVRRHAYLCECDEFGFRDLPAFTLQPTQIAR